MLRPIAHVAPNGPDVPLLENPLRPVASVDLYVVVRKVASEHPVVSVALVERDWLSQPCPS